MTGKRSYIRHPSDIPIDVFPAQHDVGDTRWLNNVSHGGLSFSSAREHRIGEMVRLRIALVRPVFEAVGRVVWCQPGDGQFQIGVEFVDNGDMFRARMVEQICHIEHYRKEALEKDGRRLSSQEAALEWIGKYAREFPSADEDAAG